MGLAVIIATNPSARSTRTERLAGVVLARRGDVLLLTALKRTPFVVGAVSRKGTDLYLVHEDRREKKYGASYSNNPDLGSLGSIDTLLVG